MESLGPKSQRTVDLTTSRYAGTEDFLTRESSTEAVVEAWSSCGIKVSHWIISLEANANKTFNI